MSDPSSYPYAVYYTYRSGVSSEVVKELQFMMNFLKEEYGLDAAPTGYSHTLSKISPLTCEGFTQDLEFMYLEDVLDFLKEIKEIPEICSIRTMVGDDYHVIKKE